MNIQGKKVSQEVRAVTSGFSELSPAVNSLVDAVTVANNYPTGAVLFSEAEPTRGIYFVRRGRVKLSVCARDGKTLILHIAGAGELMGVAAVLSQHDYEATAETLEPSEIGFLRQSDLMRLMRASGEFALWVTQQLSQSYNSTCREIRNLMLSDSASEKLARLLVGFIDNTVATKEPARIKLGMTHEEIAQMIGTSRETVTRLFAGFKKRRIIEQNGATVVIPNRVALESLISA